MSESTGFDNILSLVGDFGRFQAVLLILFSIINILSSFHYFGQTIISVIPTVTCNVSSLKNVSELVGVGKCSIKLLHDGTVLEQPCTTGYNFDTKNIMGFVGIIQDLKWVCSDEWKSSLGQSVFFLGSVIGTLYLGYLSDKIGRVAVLIWANLLVIAGTAVTLMSQNLTIFAIGRFLAGSATDSNFVMMYIIVLEYMRPSLRTIGLNLCIGIFYTLACMVVPWVAVLLGTWKSFLIFIAVLHTVIIIYYYVVPESAQWLISKGKTDEAVACFKRIAKFNGKIVSSNIEDEIKSYGNQLTRSHNTENVIGLLRTPNLRKKTLILVFKSMVMTLGYDTISRNVNGIGYSPFVVFTLGSSTIFPACILITTLQDKIGRKALASGSLFVSALCMFGSSMAQIFLVDPTPTLILILSIIARLSINITYNSGAQYAVELIPTVVRGQGVSFIHVVGYGASFFSPYILYMTNFWKPSPEVILAALLIMGAIACLFLPETLNRTLPVSLQDGENFGEGEKWFHFDFGNKKLTSSTTALNPGLCGSSYM